MHRPTKEVVAIKLMKNCFKDTYHAKKELSEINILQQFMQIDSNGFVTRIYDVIIPSLDCKSHDPIPNIFMVMELVGPDLRHVMNH